MWGTSRLFSAQAERRYAKHAAEELLELFRAIEREHPGLSGRELYRAVHRRGLGPDAQRAGIGPQPAVYERGISTGWWAVLGSNQ